MPLLDLPARTLLSGTCAAVASIAALAWHGRRETGSALAPLNAPSHWVWGPTALLRNRLTLRFTGVGVATHVSASLFWAALFEVLRLRGRRGAGATLGAAAATAAIANVVDFQLVPERLTPGYEKRLSRPALAVVYVAFAAGLAAGALAWRRR